MIDNDVSSDSLKAALRVYVEAKFSENLRDAVIPFSEIVSNQANEIYDKLIDILDSEKQSYITWRYLTEERHEFKVLIKRLKECEGWAEYSASKKQKTLDIVVSPYKLNADMEEKVMREVNEHVCGK